MLNIYELIRRTKYIGHRGLAAEAPENTLLSFRQAALRGLKVVEFDVMLSADNIPVVFHDDSLKRLAGVEQWVGDLTLAELKRFDIGRWFGPEFNNERIPTLKEVLILCQDLALAMNIEIKPSRHNDKAITVATVGVLGAQDFSHSCLPIVSSFSPKILQLLLEYLPEYPRGLLIDTAIDKTVLQQLQRYDCHSLHADHRQLDQAGIEAAKVKRQAILAYTVNDFALADRLFSWGVDGVFTDILFENIK